MRWAGASSAGGAGTRWCVRSGRAGLKRRACDWTSAGRCCIRTRPVPYEPRSRSRSEDDEDAEDLTQPEPEPEPRIDLMLVPAEDLEQAELF